MLSICITSCGLYSAGSGVKRVHVVLSGLRLFVLSPCMYFMFKVLFCYVYIIVC